MLKSEAWRSLSGAAVKLFLELHTRYNGGNNGKVRLSLNEATEALGLGKATIHRAYHELQGKGFIVLQTAGNWYGRQAHEWQLTTKALETGKGSVAPTNDWRSWSHKTERGSNTDPSRPGMGPPQNRRPFTGSATEPVNAVLARGLGSGMEH
ncbi:helix-turn-helix domain-containing protein [Frigidibacter sp. RF13]|uniref:helix-turn-helix domain-containing protein n=1 Tax=Frigidibacter sp. RF13 TaxID=2997340 RepID=UPI0022714A89|nr:helix-turn-helix domain-containing protein [Frigidibacter sp. RF13]MCY1127696.1 helix-turn-helix domain-containing protein [Frigidibacter sp. RF13]